MVPADPLRAELIEVVRVSRDIVEVRLALLNEGMQPIDLGGRLAQREEDGASVSGMALVDHAMPKKSFVLRDARDRPVCSTGLTPLGPGERRAVWARFPAPKGPTVAVELPSLPPFVSVDVPPAQTP